MTTFTTQDRQDAQRAPLTADEIVWLWVDCEKDGTQATYIKFARTIERAHGIGE
jgi:hypothetical protein